MTRSCSLERPSARRWSRALAWLFLNPIFAGAVVMLAVYGMIATRPVVSADEPVLGHNASDIANLIAVYYARDIRRIGLELAVVATSYGAGLGAVAMAMLALRNLLRRGRVGRLTGPGATGIGLVLAAFLHAACVAWWMASYPQLYSSSFWQKEGGRAAVQVFITDRLHPTGVVIVAAVAGVVFLLGRPSRWVRRARSLLHSVRRRRWIVISVLAAAMAALLTAPRACLRSKPNHSASRPNIVILASDGLRADRLNPTVMPNLDALASRGTRFDRAYTSVPRTFGSWLTLLTGRYPHHHGVRSDFPRWEQVSAPFDALPRWLAREGYATAVVSDYAGDVFQRADVGFEVTRAPRTSFVRLIRQRAIQRVLPAIPVLQSHMGRRVLPDINGMNFTADPELVADDAIEQLRDVEQQPFLLVVFFSTTHFPYAAPNPYYRRFTDPAYDGAFRYEKTIGLGTILEASPDDVRQTRALYDGASSAVDAAAKRVLDALAEDGLADKTIVVVTSDHGENLYEHGHGQGHGDHLFGDQGTHVPLVIYDPRANAPHTERAVVETVDLAPTLSELVGATPPTDVDGRSLAGAVRGLPLASEFAHAETELWLGDSIAVPSALRFPTPGLLDLVEVDRVHDDQLVTKASGEPITLFARHRMVRDGRWKLVYAPTLQGVKYILVDTREDPEELVDVSARFPDEMARMQTALWSWMLGDAGMQRVGDYLVPRGLELSHLLAH